MSVVRCSGSVTFEAGLHAVLAAPAGVDLEDVPGRAPHAARGVVERRRVLDDADDEPVLVDVHEVEGDAGIVHPELVVVPDAQVEEHPVAGGHGLPVHEAAHRVVLRPDELRLDGEPATGCVRELHLDEGSLRLIGLGVDRTARCRAGSHGVRRFSWRGLDAAP